MRVPPDRSAAVYRGQAGREALITISVTGNNEYKPPLENWPRFSDSPMEISHDEEDSDGIDSDHRLGHFRIGTNRVG
jgi:hypothetical protein